jgi:hypothetical protein
MMDVRYLLSLRNVEDLRGLRAHELGGKLTGRASPATLKGRAA